MPIKPVTKVGCVFPIVISSEIRMWQYGNDDHQEDAAHFRTMKPILICGALTDKF